MHNIASATSWVITSALLLATAFRMAAADDYPQQVNFSLVFPRNETYDISSGVLPVIFAVTNTHYAIQLWPLIGFSISNHTDHTLGYYEAGMLELPDPKSENPADKSSSVTYSGDTTYLHYTAMNVTELEGTWSLQYYIDFTGGVNITPAPMTGTASHTLSSYGSIAFTTLNGTGASLNDLVGGTANTSCAAVPFSQSVTVTNVLQNQTCDGWDPNWVYTGGDKPRPSCPVLANNTQTVVADYDHTPPRVNMTTTGSGCAPTMDVTAASAIVSKMANLMICFGPNSNASVRATSCPPKQPPGSDAPNSGSLPIAVSISVPGLAAIMAVVVGVATGVLLL